MEHSEINSLHTDTICAISTAPGTGGIAVIRISGPKAIDITDSVWHGKRLSDVRSHSAHLGKIINPADGDHIDTAVATIYRAPNSFTGEDTIELSVHGSSYIQSTLLQVLTQQGCRIAEAGEFTRRAFANGKLDLAQAEAVADVIAAKTRSAHRIASAQMHGRFSQRLSELRQQLIDLAALLELELDFSDQDVEFASRSQMLHVATDILAEIDRLANSFANGQAIANGIPIAIVGHTNAGKSTLLNTLLQRERAIVSDIHGTTRDTIEETLKIQGTLFRIIDTAGLRDTDDPVEAIGIERTIDAVKRASIVLLVIDPADVSGESTAKASIKETGQVILNNMSPESTLIILINKCDKSQYSCDLTEIIKDALSIEDTLSEKNIIHSISAKTGQGIETLLQLIHSAARINDHQEDVTVTNVRHYNALIKARESIRRVISALSPVNDSNITTPVDDSINDYIKSCDDRNDDGMNKNFISSDINYSCGINNDDVKSDSNLLTSTMAATSDNSSAKPPLPDMSISADSNYISADFIAQDLRETIHHLSTITGEITTPDILSTIFSRFCIGK